MRAAGGAPVSTINIAIWKVRMEYSVMDESGVQSPKKRQLTAAQLAELGVRKMNRAGTALQCNSCGVEWSPKPSADGSMPRGYWICPNRCNG
jgi:hypothetical protein